MPSPRNSQLLWLCLAQLHDGATPKAGVEVLHHLFQGFCLQRRIELNCGPEQESRWLCTQHARYHTVSQLTFWSAVFSLAAAVSFSFACRLLNAALGVVKDRVRCAWTPLQLSLLASSVCLNSLQQELRFISAEVPTARCRVCICAWVPRCVTNTMK